MRFFGTDFLSEHLWGTASVFIVTPNISFLGNFKMCKSRKVSWDKTQKVLFNAFATNLLQMEKSGSWFRLVRVTECNSWLWQGYILSKDAGQWLVSLFKMSLFHRCFLHILLVPGFSIKETLAQHELYFGFLRISLR